MEIDDLFGQFDAEPKQQKSDAIRATVAPVDTVKDAVPLDAGACAAEDTKQERIQALEAENAELRKKLQWFVRGPGNMPEAPFVNVTFQSCGRTLRHKLHEIIQEVAAEQRSVPGASDPTDREPDFFSTQYYPSFCVDHVAVGRCEHNMDEKYYELPSSTVPLYERGVSFTLSETPRAAAAASAATDAAGAAAAASAGTAAAAGGGGVPATPTAAPMLMLPPSSAPPSRLCFNCRRPDHTMAECPMPRNNANIAKARSDFLDQRATPRYSSRYYVEEDGEQGTKRFRAGELSVELRAALGMRAGDWPPYYGNMIRTGYPPGYVDAAPDDVDAVRVGAAAVEGGLQMFGEEAAPEGAAAPAPAIPSVTGQRRPRFLVSYQRLNPTSTLTHPVGPAAMFSVPHLLGMPAPLMQPARAAAEDIIDVDMEVDEPEDRSVRTAAMGRDDAAAGAAADGDDDRGQADDDHHLNGDGGDGDGGARRRRGAVAQRPPPRLLDRDNAERWRRIRSVMRLQREIAAQKVTPVGMEPVPRTLRAGAAASATPGDAMETSEAAELPAHAEPFEAHAGAIRTA